MRRDGKTYSRSNSSLFTQLAHNHLQHLFHSLAQLLPHAVQELRFGTGLSGTQGGRRMHH